MPTMPSGQGKPFFGVKISKPGVPVGKATDKQLISKDDFSTKTWYDNDNPRIIEGLLPNGDYGMWVSKPGFDVTNTDDNGLIFNSSQDVFKIVKTGVVTISDPGAGNTNDVIVNHGLGYVPVILGFAQGTAYNVPLPFIEGFNADGTCQGATYITLVTTTTFGVVRFSQGGGGSDYRIKYYLLQESAV